MQQEYNSPNIQGIQDIPVQNGQPQLQPSQPQPFYYVITDKRSNQQRMEYTMCNRTAAKLLGVLQINFGLMCIGWNVGMVVAAYNHIAWEAGAGWWASPFFIIAGSFGIGSAYRPVKCLIVTTMVMSILSCCTILFVISQGILTFYTYTGDEYPYYSLEGNKRSLKILGSFLIATAVAEFGVALAQSILCCKVCCDCCKSAADQAIPIQGIQNQQFDYNNEGLISGREQAVLLSNAEAIANTPSGGSYPASFP